MLLQTAKKEALRHKAIQTLIQYFGSKAPPSQLLGGILARIQAQNSPKGAPRLKPIATPSNSRSVYEVAILGRLFLVTYDKRHKELDDIQPVVG